MKVRSVYDLLRDYQRASSQTKALPEAAARELHEFARFVRNRQHILGRDPAQFRTQALGQPQESIVRRKVQESPASADRTLFRPMHPLPVPAWELMVQVEARVSSVAMSEWAGQRITVAGCTDGLIRRYDLNTAEEMRPALSGHLGCVNALTVSRDEKYAVSGSLDRTLRWWDLQREECLLTLKGHSSQVTGVAVSSDGRRVLSDCGRTMVRWWDLGQDTCLLLQGHSDYVSAVALSSNGRHALSGSLDRTLRWWDLEQGTCLRTLQGHSGSVNAVASSDDGRHALSGSEDNTVRWWDLEQGTCLRTLQGHSNRVSAVALSSDGRHALSGSSDRTLRWWDLEQGTCLRTLQGHSGWVRAVALSSDGRHALSGSDDHTLRWWDLPTGRSVAVFPCESDVSAVALRRDPATRRVLVVAGLGDGQVQFFRTENT